MAQDDTVVVTPKVDSSYYHADDAEKGIATAVPVLHKFDELDGSPRRKRFLVWSLTKKQWIAALSATIVGVVGIVLLILFLAVVPAVFQKQVDNVQLSVNHLDLLTMSSDRDANEINVELSAHIVSDAMASATMYETTATLSYSGKAFGTVTLPETELKKGKYEFDLVIKGPSVIVDKAAFREVSKAIVTSETVPVDVSATVKVHAMGMSFSGLELKRTLSVKGMNQFSSPAPKITHIAIPACTESYYQMLTNITLDNDSDIGLDGIGVLNMSVYHQQEYLGQAISIDGKKGIPRGATPTAFMLTIYKEKSTLAALGNLLKGVLSNKVQFFITGNNPYAATQAVLLDEALTKLNMSVPYTTGLSTISLNTSLACADLLSLL